MSTPYAFAPTQKTNTLAIVTLVLSIVGFTVVSIVLGFIALSQIKKTGEQGRGLAIAGIIVSFVYLVIGIIILIVYIAIIAAAVSSGNYTGA